jgi:YVTN family beta-propeller protein
MELVGKIYTAISLSNDVSVIDTSTNKMIDTVAAGDGPWGVAVREMKLFHHLSILLFLIAPVISLAQSTPYHGRVVDQNGDGIENAGIRCASGTNPVGSTRSGGWVDVDRFLCENSLFVISASGFIPKNVDLNTKFDDIVLEPSPVSATVTITGTDTTLMDSPASVIQLEHRSLQTTAAATLDDKLRQVPGFSLFRRAGSRTANPTAQGVSLRGVGASGASRALVLSDGVPLNDPFGGWVFWGRVPSEAIDEVEIIRGPASDLYGTAAIGGVIAIHTFNKSDFAARLDASYGNERTPAFSFFGSGSEDQYKVSAGWERFWTDGFIPVAPEFRGPVDDVANVRRSAFTPRITRDLSDKRSVFVEGDFYREVRANGSPLQRNDTLINNLTAGADLEFPSAGTLTIRAFGGTENYHQSFSAIAADRSAESLTRLQTVPSQVLGIRGQWAGQHGRFIYFAGGEARDIHGRSDETGYNTGTATVATSAGGREISTGLFAGTTVYITDRLFLSGGVRFDSWQNLAGFSSSRSLVGSAATSIRFPRSKPIAGQPADFAVI